MRITSFLKKVLSHKFFYVLALIPLVMVSMYAAGNRVPTPQLTSQFPYIATIQDTVNQNQSSPETNVLASQYRPPQIYVSGGENAYSAGGMIAIASTDEPAVYIDGHDVKDIEIQLYTSNDDAVLDYLAHDKDGKQIKKVPDSSKIKYVTSIKHTLTDASDKILLPLQETGIWYLKITSKGPDTHAFVVRSQIGAIVKEGDDEFIFWGQDFKSKRSVTDGVAIIYDLESTRKEIDRVSFNKDGIAKSKIRVESDIALIASGNDRAIIPINLKYLNYGGSGYKEFHPKSRLTRYFIFTDRPLYKPGDTVNFKAVLRDDDDVRFTIPSGQATVKISEGYDKPPFFEKAYGISPDGSINGEYTIPKDGKVGYYNLSVTIPDQKTTTSFYYDREYSSNYTYFNVQHYQKPEYFLDVTSEDAEVIAGEKTSFTIGGEYFSGQPLIGQKVKYSIYTADYYDYEYALDKDYAKAFLDNNYRYGWYGSREISKGTVSLDTKGQALVSLPTKNSTDGKTQVYSISVTLDDGSQTPAYARKNLLVYAGEYGIYRKETGGYVSQINKQLAIPLILLKNDNSASVDNVSLSAQVTREYWVEKKGEGKYSTYEKKEEKSTLGSVSTDSNGEAVINYTPTKTGSYIIELSGKDSKGNVIKKSFYAYVVSEEQPYYSAEGGTQLTITPDKTKYQPTDTAKMTIYSSIPNRDVFLSLDRGRVNRYQVVKLQGNTGVVDIPLTNTDIPNMYFDLSSFSDFTLDTYQEKVVVSADSKKVVVKVTPNTKKYAPGETVTLDVATTDIIGNPVSAEVAVWAVDKAIFELADSSLGNIFDTFWYERYDTTQEAHSLEGITVLMAEGGGCFVAGTQVLMADGATKNIEDVIAGDYVLTRTEKSTQLVKARVKNTHSASTDGYMIINSTLKATANHVMFVNKTWKEAGSIQVGDTIYHSSGKEIKVSSVEFLTSSQKVYNLEIEKYHTYFANNIWVHNQKGESRTTFEDTAYWNPVLKTDSSGKAQVRFKLPDNLTTWTIAAVANTSDTKVGQTTDEIVVSKDVIVRVITPNILRTGDTIYLSALLQNFTNSSHTFNVEMKFDSGDVENAVKKEVVVDSNATEQLYWKVYPKKANDTAKISISAQSINDKNAEDSVVQEIPVRDFGFTETTAFTGNGTTDFDLSLSHDAFNKKSTATISLASSITGTLPLAMKYLVDYPYGCVEQTTSRFVPAVIAKANPDIYKDALAGKNINEIIEKGISRLSTLQQYNGGWAWWTSGNADHFITSYVVEYLLEAQKSGIKVDPQMLTNAQNYLEQDSYYDSTGQKFYTHEQSIARNYGLTLLGSQKRVWNMDYRNVSPDLVALAIMSNYKNGQSDVALQGLDYLISLAQKQGDSLYWEAGNSTNFGSRDASTALAIRAILLVGGDREVAIKGASYLLRNRKTNYWSNTFATAQVTRALTELAKSGNELTPNYTYTVHVDDIEVAKGSVQNTKQIIKDIVVPVDTIKKNGSTIRVTQNGSGQLYSTVLVNQYHTDRNAKAVDNGLSISKEFINDKGPEYSLAVGDTVTVQLTVDGLDEEQQYVVIHDDLPSGLVPVNETLNNQWYGQDPTWYYYNSGDVTDKEVTENGVILTLYKMYSGTRSYTYKARVISEGTFIVPPAQVALMYAPEVYGRSSVESLTITKESHIIPTPDLIRRYATDKRNIAVVSVLIVILLTVGIMRTKNISIREKISSWMPRKNPPPDTN